MEKLTYIIFTSRKAYSTFFVMLIICSWTASGYCCGLSFNSLLASIILRAGSKIFIRKPFSLLAFQLFVRLFFSFQGVSLFYNYRNLPTPTNKLSVTWRFCFHIDPLHTTDWPIPCTLRRLYELQRDPSQFFCYLWQDLVLIGLFFSFLLLCPKPSLVCFFSL